MRVLHHVIIPMKDYQDIVDYLLHGLKAEDPVEKDTCFRWCLRVLERSEELEGDRE